MNNSCKDTTCPFITKRGNCQFGIYDEKPCEELSVQKFEDLKDEILNDMHDQEG